METIAAFTGHRTKKLLGCWEESGPKYDKICEQIEKALNEIHPVKAISGMALGIDQWAANICIKLGIPLIAAIPFIGQERRWPAEKQSTYHKLLLLAAEQIIVCEGPYASWKMQKRNEWMVDNCSILIAVHNGSSGGTANCLKYAAKIGREVHLIRP